MHFIIPLVSAFAMRSGGVGKDDRFLPFMNPPTPWANKWWRWGMGIPIAFILSYCDGKILFGPQWWLVPAIFLATNCFPYGEKSWLNFLGKDLKWAFYGLLFGACSFLVLPFGYGMIQTLLAGLSFWFLMKWSNDGFNGNYLNHAWVEFSFGLLGTVMYAR
jgi:hypothetical protein